MTTTNKSRTTSKQKEEVLSGGNDLSFLAKEIIANAVVGIYIVQDTKFVYVSELYQKMTGYTDKELVGEYSLKNIYEADREKVRNQAISCLKRENFEPYEYRFIRKDNELRYILETLLPLSLKANEPHWEALWISPSANDGGKYRTILEISRKVISKSILPATSLFSTTRYAAYSDIPKKN